MQNSKVKLLSLKESIQQGIKTRSTVADSNFWEVFNSCKNDDKRKRG